MISAAVAADSRLVLPSTRNPKVPAVCETGIFLPRAIPPSTKSNNPAPPTAMDMEGFQNSLAFWVTVIGTAVGLFGIIQSHAWLAALGVLAAVTSIGALIYARHERVRFRAVFVTVEGRTIDCLSLATLRRRMNRSLTIQHAEHDATIHGEDLTATWHYAGYCHGISESSIEFSIDADSHIPFDDLACSAFDLVNDPRKEHPIRPILIGSDGISKKVAVPLLAPLGPGNQFEVLLTCELPGCMKAGIDYCTATVSFNQDRILDYSMKLIFADEQPGRVRAYEAGSTGTSRLLKELKPVHSTGSRTEYLDAAGEIWARSARIYVFWRCNMRQQPLRQQRRNFLRDKATAA
jgi:hypothetical protein